MSTDYKCSEKGAKGDTASSPDGIVKLDEESGGKGERKEATTRPVRSGDCVELEMDIVKIPASINGINGERRESHIPLVRGYDPELSPVSDDTLMEALELPDDGDDRRWGKGRRSIASRDFILQTLAHTLAGFTGEFVGTFLLTLIIITAVASSVIADALSGLWQVAVVSGLGVALSIYLSAHISDAHLNPAVTLAFATIRFKVFSWKKIVVYILAQMLGGIAAGAVLFGLYRHAISAFEEKHGIERGCNGSELSAMVFGEYFPNPVLFPDDHSITSPVEAMLIEAWATGILVFVIFAFTDPHNTTVGSGKHKVPVPILIGATVMVLISLYGPLTQAGLNPARDFGPRIFAALAGWGKIAIPGPRYGFWAYIIGPLIGGPIGGIVYDLGAARAMRFKMNMKKLRISQPHLHRHHVN